MPRSQGPAVFGEDNRIFPHAALGFEPQDLKYRGEPTRLVVGVAQRLSRVLDGAARDRDRRRRDGRRRRQLLHELHPRRPRQPDRLAGRHGQLRGPGRPRRGRRPREASARSTPSTSSAGSERYAFLGAYTGCRQDVLPFCRTDGLENPKTYGINTIGLKRDGFSDERVEALQKAYRFLVKSKLNTSQALERIAEELPGQPDVEELVAVHPDERAGLHQVSVARADARGPTGSPRGRRSRPPRTATRPRRVADCRASTLVGIHDHHDGRAEEVAREHGTDACCRAPSEVAATRRGRRGRDADDARTPSWRGSSSSGASTSWSRSRSPRSRREADGAGRARARERGRVLGGRPRRALQPGGRGRLLARVARARLHRGAPARRASRARSLDVDVVLDLMIHDLQIVPDARAASGRRDPRGGHAGPDGPDRHRQRADRVRGRLRRQPDRLARLVRARCASSASSRRRSTARSTCRRGRSTAYRLLRRRERARASCPRRSRSSRRTRSARELADFAAAVRERRDPLVTGEVGPGRARPGRAGAWRRSRSTAAAEVASRERRGRASASSAAAASTTFPRSRGCARSGSRRRSARRRTSYFTGTLGGVPVAFLSRHGRGHRLAPTEINYRANVCGFKMLGLRRAALGVGLREPARGATRRGTP